MRVARTAVTEEVVAAARTAGEAVGIEVSEVIKDIILPAELRAAYPELVTYASGAQVTAGDGTGGDGGAAVDGECRQAAGRSPGIGRSSG